MTELMTNVCIEERTMDKHTLEGLRILAQIIARDFIANQALNGDRKNSEANDEYIPDK